MNDIEAGLVKKEPAATALWTHYYQLYGPYELRVLVAAEALLPSDCCSCFVVDTRTGEDITQQILDLPALHGIAKTKSSKKGGVVNAFAEQIQAVRRHLNDYLEGKDSGSP